MSTARIILEPNPHGKYYVAGDTVTGKVIVNTPIPQILKKARIRCYSTFMVFMPFFEVGKTDQIFDITLKLLKEPLKLAAGDNTIEFSIQIPLKRKVATVVSHRMGTSPQFIMHPSHTLEFKGGFDGMLTDDVRALEDLKICPIFPPTPFPEEKPQVFTQVQDLSGACGCFSSKIEAQVKIEGVPPSFHYSGKMSFPLKIAILPPPGVRPLNLTVSFGVETSMSRSLVEKQLFFSVTQPIDSDLLPDAEGWFHQKLVAEFDVSNYELFSGSVQNWKKIYSWQVSILYSNGKVGKAAFISYASPHASDERLTSQQKEFVAFISNPENGSKEYGK